MQTFRIIDIIADKDLFCVYGVPTVVSHGYVGARRVPRQLRVRRCRLDLIAEAEDERPDDRGEDHRDSDHEDDADDWRYRPFLSE